jgi:hypothetical protein
MYQGVLETISNRADWFGTIELINDDTGEVVTDLTGVTVNLVIREPSCRPPILSATTEDDRITFIGDGVIQWHFTAEDLCRMCAGTYEIGITVSRDDITDQELVAVLPIIDGVVGR